MTTPLDLISRASALDGSEVMTLVTETTRLVRVMLDSDVECVYGTS